MDEIEESRKKEAQKRRLNLTSSTMDSPMSEKKLKKSSCQRRFLVIFDHNWFQNQFPPQIVNCFFYRNSKKIVLGRMSMLRSMSPRARSVSLLRRRRRRSPQSEPSTAAVELRMLMRTGSPIAIWNSHRAP